MLTEAWKNVTRNIGFGDYIKFLVCAISGSMLSQVPQGCGVNATFQAHHFL